MSILPQDTIENLSQLVLHLSSSDNQDRSMAEITLENDWSEPRQVEVLLTFLAEQSVNGPDAIRGFAAVLFRRIAIKSPKNVTKFTDRNIGVISEDARLHIRAILLNGFLNEAHNQVRHKLSDAISEVAKEYSKPGKSWDDLLPALFSGVSSELASIRESAFRILAAAPEIIGEKYLHEVLPVFNSGFADSNDDVRIAACTAFVEFFKNLPKHTWGNLAPLLPNLLNSLPMFLNNGQDMALALVLESLIELVMVAPKMFKDMFSTIIEFCSAVAKNKELDSTTRNAALELLTTFAEVSPNMCKRSQNYTSAIVLITLSMLTEVCKDDDDAADWNNNSNDDDDDDEVEYDTARQSLDRVSLKLGGNSLAAPLFQLLPGMCHSGDWRERQAALMALSSAAEGCADVLMNEIPKLLELILPLIDDTHPRVQYACCNALGQISTDFADVIQRNFGSQILPALISRLTNRSVPRVQAHAAAALVNFSEEASKEIIEPYLDDLFTNLMTLLHSQKKYVQEQVLTTISAIADAAQQKFIKYYDTLMPMLTTVLKGDLGEENNSLLARCIECSSLVMLAVGKEQFKAHSQEIIQLFANIQRNCEDDEVRQQLDSAWARICRLSGKEFVQYLPDILPALLTTATATQDISVLEEDEADEYEANDEWDVIELSGRHIAVHTAALDEKVNAMELLNTYAAELKADFFPWAIKLAEIALPALDFYLHDGVRVSAAITLASTFKCVVSATGPSSPEAISLWTQICEKLCKALVSEPVPELLIAYYSCIKICIELLNDKSISSVQLDYLAEAINTNLVEIYERIKDKDDDDDEYTEDVDEDENEYTDEEILDKVNSVITSIFKKSTSDFLPHFAKIYPTVIQLINEENTILKLCGIGIIVDLLQFCGEAAPTFKDQFLPVFGDNLTSSDATIRQYVSSGIGFAVQNGGEDFKPFALSSLELMFKMISVPDSRAEENIYATESMISTIAKIIHTYSDSIPNVNEVLTQWFNYLPVIQNEQAAKFVYYFLSELIKAQHPVIQNLPKTIDYLLQPIVNATLYGDELKAIVHIARQLLGSLPAEEAVNILSKYKDSEMIKSYFNSL